MPTIAGERPPHKETRAYGCCVSTLTRFAGPPLQRPLTGNRISNGPPFVVLQFYAERAVASKPAAVRQWSRFGNPMAALTKRGRHETRLARDSRRKTSAAATTLQACRPTFSTRYKTTINFSADSRVSFIFEPANCTVMFSSVGSLATSDPSTPISIPACDKNRKNSGDWSVTRATRNRSPTAQSTSGRPATFVIVPSA